MPTLHCFLCPKKFENVDEWAHHLSLEHKGLSKEQLSKAVEAHATKQQLGNYIDENAEGASFECPECFDIFPSIEKINEHRKKIHHLQFTDAAEDKLRKIHKQKENNPQCEVCTKLYCGLIVCVINAKTVASCFNCYAEHYGENALMQLTIGTPDQMIKKMRTPLMQTKEGKSNS